MHVRVRLFAVLRERAGAGEIELELPDGAAVSDALDARQRAHRGGARRDGRQPRVRRRLGVAVTGAMSSR